MHVCFSKRITGTITKDSAFTPAPAAETAVHVVTKELPKPDISQMKPFKPTMPSAARSMIYCLFAYNCLL